MSPALAGAGVVGNLMILVALFAALRRTAWSLPMRGFASGLALMSAWMLSMVLETLRAPVWLLLLTGVVILLCLIALTAAVHLATCQRPGEEPSDGCEGPGGPGPASPSRDGGGGEPSWWPEFERQFAGYVRQRERHEAPRATPS